jgi:hypothetical protein
VNHDCARLVKSLTEVRWFIPGDGPLLDDCVAVARVDSYFCDLLADGFSVKRRDAAVAITSLKLRCDIHPRVCVGCVEGSPETWLRWELQGPFDPPSDRVEVHKLLTKRQGVEVAQLSFGDEAWWSLALRVRNSKLPRLPRSIFAHLNRDPDATTSCSYAGWLTSRMKQERARPWSSGHAAAS